MPCAGLPFVAAHGMIWVPPGYSFGEAMFGLDEVRGGSGWGAGTFAGPTGARQPTKTELSQAEHQVITTLYSLRMSLRCCFMQMRLYWPLLLLICIFE